MGHSMFHTDLQIFGKTVQHSPSYEPDVNPEYAVKGLLHIGESSVLYGPPGLGKTAIVSAVAAHAALGRDFADCLTQKTAVVYFAAEDGNGVHKRAYPYLSSPDFSSVPFYVVPVGFDMTNSDKVEEVIRLITDVMKKHNLSQSLAIYDTLNRMLGVSDENSSSVIGTYMANVERIAQAANAACLTIHHSGKGSEASPRGSSAIIGGADNVFRLSRSKEDKTLVHIVPEKTKSMDNPRILSLRISSHLVGVDRDGATVTFPKAVPQGTTGVQQRRPANDNKPVAGRPKSRTDEVARILVEEVQLGGSERLTAPQVAERTGEAFRDVRGNRDSLLKAVKRSLQSLVEQGVAETGEGNFWWKAPPPTEVRCLES